MSYARKQKPYGSKMEKFDVVGRSRGARNLPINIFIKYLKIINFFNTIINTKISILKYIIRFYYI